MNINNSTINFLRLLSLNNNKEWFDLHRSDYEKAKKNFTQFSNSLYMGLQEFELTLKDPIHNIKIFRINRDIRFSKDKTPYKNNMGVVFAKNAKIDQFSGYYFHLEPNNNSFVGGGIVNLSSVNLFKVRKYISDHFDEFSDIYYTEDFLKRFNTFGNIQTALKNPPRGFDIADPALDFIKNKEFTISASITDEDISKSSVYEYVIESFRLAKPLIDFLKKANS